MSYDQCISDKLMSQHQLSSEKGLSSIRTNAEFKMMQSIMWIYLAWIKSEIVTLHACKSLEQYQQKKGIWCED